MKKGLGFKSLLADLPVRIIDPDAETVAELANGYTCSLIWMQKFANKEVEAGRWERVWKKKGVRYVPAYRRKT